MARIPYNYREIVSDALGLAAAVSPLGLFGAIDAVGVGTVWTTMFVRIKKRYGSSLGVDPKRICVGVASGIARYYLGCKAATYACFLIPGLGPFIAVVSALGISAVCNIYFTYSFAATLIDLFQHKSFSDDEVISFLINHLKKLPNVEEVKDIADLMK